MKDKLFLYSVLLTFLILIVLSIISIPIHNYNKLDVVANKYCEDNYNIEDGKLSKTSGEYILTCNNLFIGEVNIETVHVCVKKYADGVCRSHKEKFIIIKNEV